MNKHPAVMKLENRTWCQKCEQGKGKWILNSRANHWTGTHDKWAVKAQANLKRRREKEDARVN